MKKLSINYKTIALLWVSFILLLTSCSPSQKQKAVIIDDFYTVTRGNPAAVHFNNSTNVGYYDSLNRPSGGLNIMFTDYSTQRQVYLCNRAECKHNDENCTSFFNERYNNMRIFSVDGQKTLFCLIDYMNDNYTMSLKLISFEPDGSSRREIANYGIDSYSTGHVAVSDNMIILSVISTDTKKTAVNNYLIATDLETGEIYQLYDLNFKYTMESVFKDKVYLSSYSQENHKYIVKSLSLKDGDEIDVFEFTPFVADGMNTALPAMYQDNYLYTLNVDGTSLEKINLDSGERTCLIENINSIIDTSVSNYFVDNLDNHLFVQTFSFNDNIEDSHWYNIDIYSGRISEQKINVGYTEKVKVVYPVAENDECFYVLCGLANTKVTLYGPDNLPYEVESPVPVYGIMNKSDFYNNNPIITYINQMR